MTEPTMHRRAVIRTGAVAWTAPVILTATAAPAMAVSPGGTITVTKGSTAVVSDGGGFYDVSCSGLSISSSVSLTAASLFLTVTYTPKVNEGDPLIYKYATNPTAWVGPSPGTATASNSLVYTYSGAVTAGVPVAFPNGIYFGTNVLADTNEGEGTFTLTFSSTGVTSGFTTLQTPHFAGPRPSSAAAEGARRLRLQG